MTLRPVFLLPPLALSACATPVPRVPQNVAPPPITYSSIGLERVVGQDAKALIQLFGQPDADVREGTARKLQFTSDICVLDAYLYPAKEAAEPRVTYLDTREPDGSAIDRASCVAALTRRDGGR